MDMTNYLHDSFLKGLDRHNLGLIQDKLRAWEKDNSSFWSKLDEWFANFDRREDKELAFRVFININFYSQTAFELQLRRLKEAAERVLIPQKLSLSSILLVLPNDRADSSDRHAYDITKIWGISRDQVVTLNALSESIKEKTFVFFNDTHGSGKQFINEVVPTIKKLNLSNVEIFIMAITISQIARQKIQEEIQNLSRNITIRFFPDEVAKLAGEIFTQVDYERLKKMGENVYPKHPMGYGNTGMLAAYYFQCPNNTLPIIWANGFNNECDGFAIPWNPLFEYKPKKSLSKDLDCSQKQNMNEEISQSEMEKKNEDDISSLTITNTHVSHDDVELDTEPLLDDMSFESIFMAMWTELSDTASSAAIEKGISTDYFTNPEIQKIFEELISRQYINQEALTDVEEIIYLRNTVLQGKSTILYHLPNKERKRVLNTLNKLVYQMEQVTYGAITKWEGYICSRCKKFTMGTDKWSNVCSNCGYTDPDY